MTQRRLLPVLTYFREAMHWLKDKSLRYDPHNAWMRQMLSFLSQASLFRVLCFGVLVPFPAFGVFLSPLIVQECSRVIRLTHQIFQPRLGVIDTQRKITIIQHDRTWKFVKGTFTLKLNTTRHFCSLYKNYKQIVLTVSSGSRLSVSVLIVRISTYSV